jgi:hypothetical protein
MTPKDLICFKCKHFREIEGGCDAFPEGIPPEIIEANEHDKPIKDQDNNIVFEPVEKGEG